MGKMYKQYEESTQVNRTVILDSKISFKAKGIYAYLCSIPNGTNFSPSDVEEFSNDSRFVIQSGLDELENAGYLAYSRDTDGSIKTFNLYNESQRIE